MKILLTTLNSKYIHSNIALKYLYGAAEKSGAYLDIREFTINNEEDHVYSELAAGNWDMICFSCYIWNIERILYLAENLKKANPKLVILLGGPEVSYDALELIKEHRYIDMIIKGEGEKPFAMLMKFLAKVNGMKIADADAAEESEEDSTDDAIADVSNLSEIPGLIYRSERKIFVNEDQGVSDFDEVAFPYNYFTVPEDRIIYYESSRGCPYRCAYCLSSVDKTIRVRKIEKIYAELSYFIYKNVKQVKFIDRTFNFDKNRAYDIWKYLIDNDNGITNFHFEICTELLDEKTIEMLSRARKGLFQFEVGIQTTNRDTLKAVNRSVNIEHTLLMTKKLIDLGNCEVHVDLIAGLPYETYSSFRRSFNMVYALKANQFDMGFLKLLKGTEMRERAHLYDYVYREKAPYEVISNKYISAYDLVRLKRVEKMLDFYYNRGGFEKTLEYLLAVAFETPFDFYEELSEFYYMKGYQDASHKKEDIYRILDAYCQLKLGNGIYGNAEHARELLEEDMRNTLNFDAVKKFKRKGWEI